MNVATSELKRGLGEPQEDSVGCQASHRPTVKIAFQTCLKLDQSSSSNTLILAFAISRARSFRFPLATTAPGRGLFHTHCGHCGVDTSVWPKLSPRSSYNSKSDLPTQVVHLI